MSANQSNLDLPKLCDSVYFYDEDKQPHTAWIAYVHKDRSVKGTDRPICNLAILTFDGKIQKRVLVEPARFNGERWIMIEKWSWPDEIPKKEYEHLEKPWNSKYDAIEYRCSPSD